MFFPSQAQTEDSQETKGSPRPETNLITTMLKHTKIKM